MQGVKRTIAPPKGRSTSSQMAKSVSKVFERYERQYCELSTNVSRKCNSASLVLDTEQKKQNFLEINSGIDEADVLIRKMDLEATSLQTGVKAKLLAKLREYKSDLNKLKREFNRISSPNANQAAHDELLESRMAEAHMVSAEQRERLSMSVEKLNQSSDRIKKCRRTILETEELGVSVIEDLHQQRQTLVHTHSKLYDVDNAIDKSEKVFTTMSRRITKNKWIVFSIIVALVIAIILILYYKISHH